MASQQDLFDETMPENSARKVSSSLPATLFNGVILFKWKSTKKQEKFQFHDRKIFPEIKNQWVEGILKPNSREKVLKPLASKAGEFSLFGKVESGMLFAPY